MGYIDLHVHSTASDGTLTPAEVVRVAAGQQLEAIALTDHDTVDGIREAMAEARKVNLRLVPGIELACLYQGTEIHILGLFVDWNNADFLAGLESVRNIRARRNEEILRRFRRDGFSITMEELSDGNPGTVITRAHFARVLTAKGYASGVNQAFKTYLQTGGTYVPPRETLTCEEAMTLLHKSGAFIALAHPTLYKLGWEEIRRLAALLRELGMKGLEVYHSSNNQYESGRLKDIAREFGLLPTGGSDFHGSNKPDIAIGRGRGGLRVSSLLLDDIIRLRDHSRP